MSRSALLVVPCCEKGRGGGHLVRCANLVRELCSLGRDARLFIARDNEIADRIACDAGFDPAWIIRKPDLDALFSGAETECIVIDNFQTAPEDFLYWKKFAPLIGIDEGGPCRGDFDFLIDMLPNTATSAPNIFDPSLLNLPEKKERLRARTLPLKILVSFGQEDSAGLGIAAARSLAAKNSSNALDITLLANSMEAGQGFAVHANIPRLAEHLGEYDLLVTHYGITAFEALYAGIPALLVSPTAYHEKLAKACGFFSVGVGTARAGKIAALLFARNGINVSFLDELEKKCAALAACNNLHREPARCLSDVIDGFAPAMSLSCPVCGAPSRGKIAARFPERSYRRCTVCGVIYMNRVNPPPIEYAQDYFFADYKKQYGKTYIEDFPNLIAMARGRLVHIQKLLCLKVLPDSETGGKARLLDIGCAYGPFLAAAQEAGFAPRGIDPAADAVRYVREQFGIPARQGCFPQDKADDPDGACFDVVTLWYVIEHLRDCAAALAEIRRILKPGGIAAFATPSFSGISGRASLRRFLQNSPADHWTVWSAGMCVRALKKAGFTVKKIISSGHHPERFPVLGKYVRGKKNPLYAALLAISRIFSLGDTFEVYAVRD